MFCFVFWWQLDGYGVVERALGLNLRALYVLCGGELVPIAFSEAAHCVRGFASSTNASRFQAGLVGDQAGIEVEAFVDRAVEQQTAVFEHQDPRAHAAHRLRRV